MSPLHALPAGYRPARGGGAGCRRSRAAGAGVWFPRLLAGAAFLTVQACTPGSIPAEPLEAQEETSGIDLRELERVDEHLSAAADEERISRAVEAFSAALALRARGDTARAVEALLALAAEPALGDWALAVAADLSVTGGRPERTGELTELLPRDLRERWGWRPIARARIRAGDAGGALPLLAAALERADAAADSAEAYRLLGEAAATLGDSAEARTRFAAALRLAPTSRPARAAAMRLTQVGLRTPEEHLALVRYYAAAGDLPSARRALDRVLGLPGFEPGAGVGPRLEVARLLLARGRLTEAEQTLNRALAAAADPHHRASALMALARVRMRQGRNDAAQPLLEQAARLGSTPAGQEALYILADLDQDAGREDLARDRFQRALQHLPATEWAAESAVRLGTAAFVEGRLDDAIRIFEGYRTAHPAGWRFQQAVYWAGLSYRQAGDETVALRLFGEAAEADPATYYGLRAAEAAGLPALGERLPPGPAPDPEVDRLARGALARVEALRSLGLEEFATLELARQKAHLGRRPGGLHALAEATHERGRFLEAVRLGREIRRALGAWDARLLRIVFPFPYQDEIVAAAQRNGVDPYLMAGLIRQESLFEPNAVSTAGAMGLMQLIPRTARDLASRGGLARFEPPRLREVEVNVALGAMHLRELLRRHGERVHDVLAEYNAGAGRLARWRSFPEYPHVDAFVERIPYRETREYVRTVTENAAIYRALYAPRARVAPLLRADEVAAER